MPGQKDRCWQGTLQQRAAESWAPRQCGTPMPRHRYHTRLPFLLGRRSRSTRDRSSRCDAGGLKEMDGGGEGSALHSSSPGSTTLLPPFSEAPRPFNRERERTPHRPPDSGAFACHHANSAISLHRFFFYSLCPQAFFSNTRCTSQEMGFYRLHLARLTQHTCRQENRASQHTARPNAGLRGM